MSDLRVGGSDKLRFYVFSPIPSLGRDACLSVNAKKIVPRTMVSPDC